MLRTCGLERGRVFSAVLPLLLFPPAAAHAGAIVARELYAGFEPLAVARLLLPPAEFDRLTRRPGTEAAGGGAGENWSVDALVRELLQENAPRPAPPASRDAAAAAFCPSCLAEYRAGFSRCSDCDVPLEPYVR
jgi:hypothetical protein